MDDLDRRKAIVKLLESAALSAREVDLFFERALDIAYWRILNPDLSVEADTQASQIEAAPLTEPQLRAQLENLRREGYFQTGPVLDPALVGRMRAGVERLRQERWPHVFAYVYDEFWRIVRTPSVRRIAEGFLGEECRQNSLIWTYYVAPVKGAEGWPPHSEAIAPDNDSRLTLWIPLSEATIQNGCMYVIPRDRMPKDLPRIYRDMETVTNAQLSRLLQATKALPSPPGAFLGWNHETIHWGSASSGRTSPRISLAVEFIRGDVKPHPSEPPLFELSGLPSFSERIPVIAKSLLEYGRFEPSVRRYAELGRRLKEHPAASPAGTPEVIA